MVSSRLLVINDSLLASNLNFINSSIGVVLLFFINSLLIDIDSHHEDSF